MEKRRVNTEKFIRKMIDIIQLNIDEIVEKYIKDKEYNHFYCFYVGKSDVCCGTRHYSTRSQYTTVFGKNEVYFAMCRDAACMSTVRFETQKGTARFQYIKIYEKDIHEHIDYFFVELDIKTIRTVNIKTRG